MIGEKYAFNVKVNSDGSLVLLAIQSDGAVSVVYPNGYFPNNKIKAGTKAVIPREGFLEATPPSGTEQFCLFLLDYNPFAELHPSDLYPILPKRWRPVRFGSTRPQFGRS